MAEQDPLSTTTPPPPSTEKAWQTRLLWLFAALIVPIAPVRSLRQYASLIESDSLVPGSAQADCAIVLTGGGGRVREGINLLSHKNVKKLVISGVHQHSTLADIFPEMLFYPEIDLENVILERRSSSTAGNAQLSLPIIETLHCQTVLLVTSDYHMHRALKTFAAVFPAEIQVFSFPVTSTRLLRRPVFFDTRFWSTVFDEWVKYLFYKTFVF